MIYISSTFFLWMKRNISINKFMAWTKKWTANKFEYNLIFLEVNFHHWAIIIKLFFYFGSVDVLKCMSIFYPTYNIRMYLTRGSDSSSIFNLYYDFFSSMIWLRFFVGIGSLFCTDCTQKSLIFCYLTDKIFLKIKWPVKFFASKFLSKHQNLFI